MYHKVNITVALSIHVPVRYRTVPVLRGSNLHFIGQKMLLQYIILLAKNSFTVPVLQKIVS
jgi:hypothetical protein